MAGALSPKHCLLILLAVAFCLFFIGLNCRELWGSDEPRVAGIAAETAIYGNWIEPSLNDKIFLEKPPLYFWTNALSFKLFGFNDFAAKLPSALSAFVGVIAVFMLARAMGGSGFTSLLSALLLATSAQYWRYGRKCMIDMMLAAFIMLAMWAFFELAKSEKIRTKCLWLIAFILSAGGAVFSKGLVGLAIPAVAIGAWLFFGDLSRKKISFANWLFFIAGSILCFVPVSIWLWFLYHNFGYEALWTVVWTNNFGRFSGSHPEHEEPLYYYLLKLPEQLQPWTVLLPFGIIYSFMTFKKREFKQVKSNYSALFMLCWLFIPYILLTISAGKRQVYLLPLYAAETLMIGFMAGEFIEGKLRLPFNLNPEKLIQFFIILFSVVVAAAPFVFLGTGIYYKASVSVLLVSTLPGILVAIFTIHSLQRKAMARFCSGVVIAFVLAFVMIGTVLFPQLYNDRSFRKVFEYCQEINTGGKAVYVFQPQERLSGAAVYYLGRKTPEIFEDKVLNEMLAQGDQNAIIVTYGSQLKHLQNYKILQKFKIKNYDMVVITSGAKGSK